MAYSYEECISELEELFDIETQLIVLDDIDTLTTANKDGGMEELFLLLSRAKIRHQGAIHAARFPFLCTKCCRGSSKPQFRRDVSVCPTMLQKF
jgi:hypothetical protein